MTMHFAWPVEITEEPEGFTAIFPDVPGAVTWGATRAEAMERAEDALVSVISAMIDDGQRVPSPSAARGRPKISIPPLDAAKIALHGAMLDARISNVELAHRMGMDEKAIRRLRDPLQRSRIDAIILALRMLGKRVELSVFEDAH